MVNNSDQYGDLVLEIVCANSVTQTDAIDACKGYVNHVTVPQEGEHIIATGPYVLDTDHGWREIHPVYSFTVTASPKNSVTVTGENLNIHYPDGSANGWLGPSRFRAGTVTVNSGEQFTDTLSLYSTSSYPQEVTGITISTAGFSMKSTFPNTPINFTANAIVDVTLTIQAPATEFSGPIYIQFTATQ
jgi:hypothetical protein